MKDDVMTIGETAKEMGLHRQTITDVVRTLNLTYKPVPRNGNAKGLDSKDRAEIRKVLKVRKASEAVNA